MYKYEYVKIDNEAIFGSIFTIHRKTIDQYAEKGYRYVGFIPSKSDAHGKNCEIDLIFEKQE